MMTELPHNTEDSEQSFINRSYTLRAHDQKTIAVIAGVLFVVAVISTAWYAWQNGGLVHYDDIPQREAVFQVDVNTAEWPEIAALPEIGPSSAKAIVAYREEFGPFQSVQGLQEVSGIGKRTVDKIKPYLANLPATESFDRIAKRSKD